MESTQRSIIICWNRPVLNYCINRIEIKNLNNNSQETDNLNSKSPHRSMKLISEIVQIQIDELIERNFAFHFYFIHLNQPMIYFSL